MKLITHDLSGHCRWWSLCLGLLLAPMAATGTETLVDPTQPPAVVLQRLPMADADAEPVLTLTAIKQSGSHSFAIINARVVKLGERVQGYTLLAVAGTHVVLQDAAQRRLTLTLDVVDFRRPVKATADQPPAGKHTPVAKKH